MNKENKISEKYIIEQVKDYSMESCIEITGYLSTDIDNLITGENASLSMIRMEVSKETYKEAIERNLTLINEVLKCIVERMKELNEQRK